MADMVVSSYTGALQTASGQSMPTPLDVTIVAACDAVEAIHCAALIRPVVCCDRRCPPLVEG